MVSRTSRASLVALIVTASSGVPVLAQQLPIRAFSSRDGLGSDFVQHIVEDAHGYVWFSTRDGLSRWDGYRFVNYTTAHGLPSPTVFFCLPARNGEYWVASGGRLLRFRPDACANETEDPLRDSRCPALFEPIENGPVGTGLLHEDDQDTLWAAGDRLYRCDRTTAGTRCEAADMGSYAGGPADSITDLTGGARGGLWMSTRDWLGHRSRDGNWSWYTGTSTGGELWTVLEESDGTLWVGGDGGLLRFPPRHGEPPRGSGENAGLDAFGTARHFTTADGLPHLAVRRVRRTPDGRLWVTTRGGLATLEGDRLRTFRATSLGLEVLTARALAADSRGQLWLASTGLFRLDLDGLVSYDVRDGLRAARQHALFEDPDGVIYSVGSDWWINRLQDNRFTPSRAAVSQDAGQVWDSQVAFLDRDARWWVLTRAALYRFPPRGDPGSAKPERVFGAAELKGGSPIHLHQDRSGTVWIGTIRGSAPLLRWTSGAPDRLLPVPTPEAMRSAPRSFAEDRHGDLWIGLGGGGLLRYRDRDWTAFGAADGLPRGAIADLWVDQENRLWIASSAGGLGRIDRPGEARPGIRTYTTADGLRSANLRCLTEDRQGRIYAGGVRGIDRLDPVTGELQHFGTDRGLAADYTMAALRDRSGELWFATTRGVSRLDPALETRSRPRAPRFHGLTVNGNPVPLSELGESRIAPRTFGPDENQFEVAYHAPGGGVAYQYRLEGGSDRWSPPTSQRSVVLTSLAPGRYRFLVRTVPDGQPGEQALAEFAFVVRPPVWRRAWFVGLVALLVGGFAVQVFRLRLARAIELERVRTQIATDLHDDIGASLSQMAILSEVARQRQDDPEAMRGHLTEIAGTSRELVDSMSDIVWAVDPRRDALRDLTRRMRRFASDAMTAKGVVFRLDTPDGAEDLQIRADVRRQLLLVFKEAINNALRHSDCSCVKASLALHDGRIELRVADDGRGFDPSLRGDGQGLRSIRARAEALGGTVDVDTAKGAGTRIRLRLPRDGRSGGGNRPGST